MRKREINDWIKPMEFFAVSPAGKDRDDLILDLVLKIRDYAGLTFKQRMILSNLKIKILQFGAQKISSEEIALANSILSAAPISLQAA
ncbi:MAG: hypothetical protein EBT19_04395 [Methylocystaceae bacterium]|nr:hypothetical protein [Methylocystaceae bacterium]NBV94635.1 hypothetical protein [Methylocystaceae bacterium]